MHPITSRVARGAIVMASLVLAIPSGLALAQTDESPAPRMSVEVSGLAQGDLVTGNRIDITVRPVGFELSNTAGTPPVEGKGHYHVIFDGGLVNMFTTPAASVSLQNVSPGPHTLMVVPAGNDHMEAMDGAAAIDFEFQPAEPIADITSSPDAPGSPSVRIVSPTPGAVVSGSVDIVVQVTGLTLSGELLGKPNVDGYGHWHAFLDAAEGMGTMAGMSGTDTLTIDTSALAPGPHMLIAVLTDNLHAPLDPMAMAAVEVEVVADDAGLATGDVVAVSLQEWGLVPAELTLAAGSYTFVDTNDGTIAHGLALEGGGLSAATPDASYAPGASETFTLDLVPGTYEIFCPVPGHKQAGMVATLTVTG